MITATILLHLSLAAGGMVSTTTQPVDTLWHDPSPHRVLHVSVAPLVTLEVLDWGGSGLPVIFLAGGGNTAHVYELCAPLHQSLPCHRHYSAGLRRVEPSHKRVRHNDTGARPRCRLDRLGIPKATFVAHSFGGSELNYLGAHYPERVDRLVYLDSAFDFRALFESPEWKSGLLYGAPQPPTPSYDDETGTAWSWTLWVERVSGPGVPEAEIRAIYKFDTSDRFVGSASVEDWLKRLERGN